MKSLYLVITTQYIPLLLCQDRCLLACWFWLSYICLLYRQPYAYKNRWDQCAHSRGDTKTIIPVFKACLPRNWESVHDVSHFFNLIMSHALASCQIRKIAGCACACNIGSFSPATGRSRDASQHVRDAHAEMHGGIANQRFPLTSGVVKTLQAFPAHAQYVISNIRTTPETQLFLCAGMWHTCRYRFADVLLFHNHYCTMDQIY